jgi:hypothetical protein
MKRIGDGTVWILYSVLFCLVSLGLTLVPSPQITMAQAASAFDSAWDALTNVENLVNDLPDSAFRNRNNRNALQAYVIFLTLGTVQPALPATTSMPYLSPFMDQFMKYAVVRDPTGTFNTLSIDPENPGPYAHRISKLSKMLDTSTHISAFVARGAKLLIAHGLQDVLVSTRASEMYWELLQAQFGPTKVRKFARYYEVPGAGHAFGAAFTPGWDSLTALENWVEKGIAPANQIVTDTAVHAGRTRPLCEYPAWPRYNGYGDPNLASNFICSED